MPRRQSNGGTSVGNSDLDGSAWNQVSRHSLRLPIKYPFPSKWWNYVLHRLHSSQLHLHSHVHLLSSSIVCRHQHARWQWWHGPTDLNGDFRWWCQMHGLPLILSFDHQWMILLGITATTSVSYCTMTAGMSTVRVCVIHASPTSPRVGIIDLDVTSHFSCFS